ncbi:DUF1684 domain-containing protein [Fibrella sp. HMF5335]|uniref:DUF1684 domain-containing protein n=1 Tax=Fibrella rubiginis TaxID=2817060 RepID=A0A939GI41_9BACT|nr:DUF1684 domain-containing protein [Fibrella rubiginis]MBO0938218.1 DUF1684 domain-containing protein [Fibrella rubiginis]
MRLLTILFTLQSSLTLAQTTYDQHIEKHRQAYRAEFLASGGSPLKTQEAVSLLRFYAPDSAYRVVATVLRTPKAKPIAMPTHTGQTSEQVSYAQLSFVLNGQPQTLVVYRSLALANNPLYRDYLFLPFKDGTTGGETYGGGRYLDLRMGEIKNDKLVLDFNKAYNPYCAYGEGYSCPIPPASNKLAVRVLAGELNYGRVH